MAATETAMRVLVVDDNEDVALGTSLLLRMLGCDAELATSGEIALEKALAFVPDLMLIDLAMPHLDGHELVNQFRLIPAFGDKPMIAVSGYVDAVHRQRAFEAGFDGFVSKPFTAPELENVCNHVRAVIAQTKTAIEQSKAAADTTRRTSRRCQAELDEFWLNRRVSD